jgi:DNA polymerase
VLNRFFFILQFLHILPRQDRFLQNIRGSPEHAQPVTILKSDWTRATPLSVYRSMSVELSIIAEELRRLQQAGVERVFVGDLTVENLRLSAVAAGPAQPKTRPKQGRSGSHQAADLRSLMDAPAKPQKALSSPIEPAVSNPQVPEAPPRVTLPDGDAATQLAYLKEQVLACLTCNAHLNPGGKVVFGAGNPSADLFFCGEAPGADEEAAGEPFVGKAGQLLEKIVEAMGLKREEVYIANILNWRPQHDKPYGNRPPSTEEMRFCLPYLEAQISIVRPKIIVALGNTAVSGLLGPDPKRKMGTVRGTWQQFNGIPLMITFHPSYLLRNGTLKTKRIVWEDMLQVMERCQLAISDRQRGFFLPK